MKERSGTGCVSCGRGLSGKRAVEIQFWSPGYDPLGIDGLMAEKIMLLDMLEIYSFAYSWLQVDFTGEGMELQIVTYPPQVGLEVGIVDRIEADEGGEKAPIRFADYSPQR